MTDTTIPEESANHLAAFLVVARHDGTFFATADLNEVITTDRVANRQDIKHGCRDILDIISYSDQANMTSGLIMDFLAPKEEETVAGSIREALDERGIL